ncbi:isopeptide-forming domain-containing fimbrial protein [Marinicrinis lubricantis]|uniref:Isopeptide-forming domain-containing fimbrial protein n=1 Tax=Marinicrinis lubricantis TaxID=2086470 RepID=A0ABW1IRD1_9BACL
MQSGKSALWRSYLSRLGLDVMVTEYTKVPVTWKELDFIPDYNRLYFITEGEGYIKVGDTEYYPGPGSLVLMPTGNCPPPVALMNGSFDEPEGPGTYDNSVAGGGYYYADTVPGWETTDFTRTPRGIIQIMDPARPSTIPPNTPDRDNLTSRFAELNADTNSMLYHELPTVPGQTIYWRLDHRGYNGVDTMSVNIGPVTADPFNTTPEIKRISTGTTWETYSGSYTVPAGQTVTRFGFKAISTSNDALAFGNYLDNIFLGTEPCVVADKSVSPEGEVFEGDELTYEVKVKNEGGDIAADAVFEDVIPEGTEYIPGSMKIVSGPNAGALTDADDQDAGHFDGQKVIIRLGDLPNTTISPDGITVQFKVKALSSHAADSIANKATIGYKNLLTNEDETIESNEVTTSVEYRAPKIESVKTAAILEKATGNTDDGHPEVGDTLLYTIQARNTVADSRIENLLISDVIPEGLKYVPGTLTVNGKSVTDTVGDDEGHYADGQVVGEFGHVTDTDWHTVTFQVKIMPGQASKDIRNVAVVDGDNITTPSEPDQIVEVYPRIASLESNKSADLLAKADGNTDAAHPEVGDTLLYTIQARNTVSDSVVTNFTITDDIPEGLEYVPGTLTVDAAPMSDGQDGDSGHYADGQVFGRFGNVTDTAWRTVTFQATVLPGQAGKDIRNVAVVKGDNVTTPSNPEETVEVYPRGASLESDKSASLLAKADGNTDAGHAEVGDTLLYTVQARNTIADSLITNLTITDEIPAGLEYVPGTLTVDGASVSDGKDGDRGHYTDGKVVGEFGDVTDTEWHTITFQAKVAPGQAGKDIRNVAVVDGDNVTTPSEPEELVEVYPRGAVLESSKTATLLAKADGNTDAGNPEVGDTLLYTIQTRNTLTDSLVTNLTITDDIPAGLEYVPGTLTVDSASVSDGQDGDQGHYTDGKVFAQFGDVTDTQWHTVTFQVKILPGQAGKDIINIAKADGDNVDSPSRPREKVLVYPRHPVLESEKFAVHLEAGKTKFEVGDIVVYTIRTRTVVNDTYLENLTITDVLPAGLEFVPGSLKVDNIFVTDEVGDDAGHSVTGVVYGSFGNVTDMEWHTLEFQAIIQSGQGGQIIPNTASIVGDNLGEPSEPTEKIAVEVEPPPVQPPTEPPVEPPVEPEPPVVYPPVIYPPVDPPSPVLESEKSTIDLNGDSVRVGDTIEYTIRVRNTVENSRVTNLEIADVLPAGLEYVANSLKMDGQPVTDAEDGDNGQYTNGIVTGKFGTVTDADWHTVVFQAKVKAGQEGRTIENIGQVTADNIGEPSTPSVTIIIENEPDAEPPTEDPGEGTTPTEPGDDPTPAEPGTDSTPNESESTGDSTVTPPGPLDESSGDKLPNTATNMYSLALFGIIILLSGWFLRRKSRVS